MRRRSRLVDRRLQLSRRVLAAQSLRVQRAGVGVLRPPQALAVARKTSRAVAASVTVKIERAWVRVAKTCHLGRKDWVSHHQINLLSHLGRKRITRTEALVMARSGRKRTVSIMSAARKRTSDIDTRHTLTPVLRARPGAGTHVYLLRMLVRWDDTGGLRAMISITSRRRQLVLQAESESLRRQSIRL